jgi:hypothetical protein
MIHARVTHPLYAVKSFALRPFLISDFASVLFVIARSRMVGSMHHHWEVLF